MQNIELIEHTQYLKLTLFKMSLSLVNSSMAFLSCSVCFFLASNSKFIQITVSYSQYLKKDI